MSDDQQKGSASAGPCPSCGAARVTPIVYGLPGPELAAAAARREIVLGGCCIWGDERDHKWRCAACGWRFGGTLEGYLD